MFDDCFNSNFNVVSTLRYRQNEYNDFQYSDDVEHNLDWYISLNIATKELSASMFINQCFPCFP